MFYRFHRKSPWLKRVLVPCWALQLIFMLVLISVSIWSRAYTGSQNPNIVLLIISAVCTVLSVTEIILFAATRLHPLTYLILQLAKTITWLVLFALAAVDTMTLQEEMKDSIGIVSDYVFLEGFVETLVLFITFLGALIYASVIYHRHRRAKSRFFRSVQGTDLFPVIADEGSHPVHSHRTFRAPRTSIKEFGSGAEVSYPAELKEAVEVTVLRELGGDWDVYELAATRSARSSKGGKSVRKHEDPIKAYVKELASWGLLDDEAPSRSNPQGDYTDQGFVKQSKIRAENSGVGQPFGGLLEEHPTSDHSPIDTGSDAISAEPGDGAVGKSPCGGNAEVEEAAVRINPATGGDDAAKNTSSQ